MKIKDPTCPNKDPAQPNKWTNIFLKDCTLEYSLVKYSLWTKFCLLFESESESGSVVSNSLWPCGLYSPWNSPGQNTGVDNCSLFQGIFSTQGLNPGLPHCRWILYLLSYSGSLILFILFILVLVNKGLLEQSHSFIYCPWQLACYIWVEHTHVKDHMVHKT